MGNIRDEIAETIGITTPNTVPYMEYHKRYPGGHALTKKRFNFIIE